MIPGKEKIRLQAYLAACGLGSRRSCEKFIIEGRVTVNSRAASLGDSVFPGDAVELDGKLLRAQERLRYILLYKPAGYLSSMSDPEGRPCAIDLVKTSVEERVYNVGRLDQWSSGLLLFTNDGELAARMGHPSGNFEKEYDVRTDLDIPAGFAVEFLRGVRIDGVVYRARSVETVSARGCRITLVEGKNREIRRVLEHFGLRALDLCRMRIGPLRIGNLAPGMFRDLESEEIAYLKASPSAKGAREDGGT